MKGKNLLIIVSALIIVGVVAVAITTGVLLLDETAELNQGQAKEPVVGEHVQAVVSSQRLATEAGLEILEAGGSAADAAVAVAAVLSVVEPWFSSVLGGGTWALHYDASTDEVTSLDGVGPVGSRASVGDYNRRGGDSGMHQAVVPGAWDGWMIWLDRHGRLDLGEVLAPAIRIAREGHPASAEMADWLNRQSADVLARPDARRIYAPAARVLRAGETVRQVDMANTFEVLVAAYDRRRTQGRTEAFQAARDYFYRGPLAEAIVEFSNRHNGYLTLNDFRNFAAEIVEPLSIDYKDGIKVYQNPPNSQGITMLLALNILKGFDFSGLTPNDPLAVHWQVEAIKLAFADRHYHVGDPARVNVPVRQLLSDEHAAQQRARINPNQALRWPIADRLNRTSSADPGLAHTTTFHVVDKNGNAVAVTTSLGAQFLVIGDTGIHINNRMRMIALEVGNPNQLTPGYKVRHTSNPYMAFRNGRPYILGGNTGVDTQPQGQVQQFISVVEFGLTPQEAVARPRFISTAFPATSFPYRVGNKLQLESGFASSLIQALRARGHDVETGVGTVGSANMIVIDADGRSASVGAEPRSQDSHGRVVSSSQ
jgi:gamma-glutamyltranspeptidase / glutathione hydrolase